MTTIDQYSNDEFRKHFRLQKCVALPLTERIQVIVSDDLSGWDKVSKEKAPLMTIWYLANKETFRQLADRFNVTESCAHAVIKKVTKLFSEEVGDFIKWPAVTDLPMLATNFKKKKGVPKVIGAIDGSHIPINRPLSHEEDFVNRKGFHSVLLQGIVDDKCRFVNIYVGKPGSIHDARMLRRSRIYTMAHEIIPHGFYILGDSAYPLLPWLVPPYKDNGHLTNNQREFDYRHSATRIVVEHAFGILKGRFRKLQHFDNRDLEFVNNCIITGCVLHNVCIDQNDFGSDLETNDNNPVDDSDADDASADNQDNVNHREVMLAEMFQNGE